MVRQYFETKSTLFSGKKSFPMGMGCSWVSHGEGAWLRCCGVWPRSHFVHTISIRLQGGPETLAVCCYRNFRRAHQELKDHSGGGASRGAPCAHLGLGRRARVCGLPNGCPTIPCRNIGQGRQHCKQQGIYPCASHKLWLRLPFCGLPRCIRQQMFEQKYLA